MYQGISDALGRNLNNGRNIGIKRMLSTSFTDLKRYMNMNFQDAIAICRVHGPPNLFVTFTCNPKWPEIADALRLEPGQRHYYKNDL